MVLPDEILLQMRPKWAIKVIPYQLMIVRNLFFKKLDLTFSFTFLGFSKLNLVLERSDRVSLPLVFVEEILHCSYDDWNNLSVYDFGWSAQFLLFDKTTKNNVFCWIYFMKTYPVQQKSMHFPWEGFSSLPTIWKDKTSSLSFAHYILQ